MGVGQALRLSILLDTQLGGKPQQLPVVGHYCGAAGSLSGFPSNAQGDLLFYVIFPCGSKKGGWATVLTSAQWPWACRGVAIKLVMTTKELSPWK